MRGLCLAAGSRAKRGPAKEEEGYRRYRHMKFLIPALAAVLCASALAVGPSLEKSAKFQAWLKSNEKDWAKKSVSREGEEFNLIDNTRVSLEELKTLFALEPVELAAKIKDKGVKIDVLCAPGGRQTFKSLCSNDFDWPGFKKNSSLQGQFKPLQNTILLRSSALKGSLVHEYIHYLQYHNKQKVFGRRYKAERVRVEKALIKDMDKIVDRSRNEASKAKPDRRALFKDMGALSQSLASFGKWQDLIDERGIFLLYLKYGGLIGAGKADIALARKNMGFICGRKDLKKLLPKEQCQGRFVSVEPEKSGYFAAIKDVIEEVRPKPDLSLVEKFIKGAPDAPNGGVAEKTKVLSRYIFKEWKIAPDVARASRKNQDNILPDTVLKGKRGHCVGLSALYLLGFEKWGVDAFLTRTPKHVLVSVCESKKCLNIETLEKGKVVSDAFYVKNGYMSQTQADAGVYLKKEGGGKKLKSSLYLSLGYIAASAGQTSVAELLYKKAVDNDRSFAQAYSNLSALYARTNNPIRAKAYGEIALKVNPVHVPGMVNKSVLLWKKGKIKEALSQLKKAQKINPLAAEIFQTRAAFMREKGDKQKQFENLLVLSLMQSGNCSSHSKLMRLKGQVDVSKVEEDFKQVQATYQKHCR